MAVGQGRESWGEGAGLLGLESTREEGGGGPLRGRGKAEGTRTRPRAAREHPTEREEDGEPRESPQREERDLRQV